MNDSQSRPRRKPSFDLRRDRRRYARDRVAGGAGLSPDERTRLLAILAQLDRGGDAAIDDLVPIEYAIVHYWHLMASLVDDEAARLAKIARLAVKLGQALADLPQHYLQAQADADDGWSLVAVDAGCLQALEDGVEVVLLEVQSALRRQPAGDCAQGSRVALVQHAVERLEHWATCARKAERGKPVERELRWLLTGLRRVWTERLGRPFEPQGAKRGSFAEFVGQIVAIADPALPAETPVSLLRKLGPPVSRGDVSDAPSPGFIDVQCQLE